MASGHGCERVRGVSRSSAAVARGASACRRDGASMKPRNASRGRLTRSAEFERVYRQGRSTANRYLVLYIFPNPAIDQPRVGLSVSRRVGGAVQRNRVKRVLREAVAAAAERLGSQRDVVVLARPDIMELVESEGLAGVHASLVELIDRKPSSDVERARRRAA
jgi:ribonuclease P protein component